MIGKYITIKDKEYKLKMPFNNMVELTEKYPDVGENLSQGILDMGALRLVFYYQLKHKDNDLKKFKIEDAGDLITDYIEDGNSIADLAELITNVQLESMGISQKDLEAQKLGETKGEK